MERRFKERLIGASVLVMSGVIFIPMLLDNTSGDDVSITETNIPARPKDDFNSRIVPLQGSDLTPIPVEHELPAQTEPMVEVLEEAPEPIAEKTPAIEEDKKQISPKHMGATAWVVQLGSFSNEENAKGLNEKLRKAHYPAFVEPVKRESGIRYRVRVGPELLRSDASILQEKLKKSMHIDGIVIRYP